jgi:hypothetical protein
MRYGAGSASPGAGPSRPASSLPSIGLGVASTHLSAMRVHGRPSLRSAVSEEVLDEGVRTNSPSLAHWTCRSLWGRDA